MAKNTDLRENFISDSDKEIDKRLRPLTFEDFHGQKKIIELFGDYWHKDEDPSKRINIFAKYGYSTLVVWEKELADSNSLIERLREFHEVR